MFRFFIFKTFSKTLPNHQFSRNDQILSLFRMLSKCFTIFECIQRRWMAYSNWHPKIWHFENAHIFVDVKFITFVAILCKIWASTPTTHSSKYYCLDLGYICLLNILRIICKGSRLKNVFVYVWSKIWKYNQNTNLIVFP